jgi:hypothetical protein
MQSIAVCWSVCCSRFADRRQLGDDAAAEPLLWNAISKTLGTLL